MQTEASTSTEKVVKKAEEVNVNWPYYEIKKDGEVKGYLLGTIHIGKEEMYPFPEKILTDLNKTENFITEINDDDEASVEETTSSMISDTPLTEKMSEETRKKFQTILASYDLTEEKVAQLNRYGLSMFLFTNAMSASSDDFDLQVASQYGVENQLMLEHQKKTNQKKIALETKQFQNEISKQSNELPEDINDWVDTLMTREENMASSSNVAAIQEYIDGVGGTSGTTEEQNQVINISRNKTWAEKLPQYLENENQSFIAVGNAHVGEKEGLVELLQQKGYEVSKVTF
ncbi:TraB/GumN family protein [Enterococcus sp. LJL99]